MPSRVTDPAAPSDRFVPGATIGERYRIVGLLGRGGMGEVYRADDLELGQSVALKFLPQRLAADPEALDRLRGEVRTARKIAHPNVCRVYDIAQADGHVFLTMEYVDGDDLSHVLRRLGPPSKSKAIEIARQLCLGIAAAHENNILHRDLKPANVMLDGRGRVRITDFGLAVIADELEVGTRSAGTPAYMAPEQLASGTVSVRSDVYSLGLVLYELFTGKRAYAGKTIEELKRSRTSGSVPSMQTEDESFDPAIERVILRCLELNPADRPPSVYAVLAALPGGDPLAAVMAAGETPSPELVANIRDAGGLRPRTAVSLVIGVLASLTLVYFVFADSTIMPERSPAVLSVVAEQVLERLGYTELPPSSVSGFEVNADLSGSVLGSSRPFSELAEMDRPPRFVYWRRWTEGAFRPWVYHGPEVFRFDGATTTPWSDVGVALDSSGRLLRLRVPPHFDPEEHSWSEDVDWSPLFDLAGLDPSRATPLERPPAWPSVPNSTAAAWKIDDWPDANGEPTIVVMAARGQRLVYFELHRIDQTFRPVVKFPFVTTFSVPLLHHLILVVLVILALRNLRAGRSDRRNAVRAALVIGALYTLYELLALPLGGPINLDRIGSFIGERAIGHITIHTLEGWLAYMAIEPYVRRVWPRMLVGLVRLLSGRWRDPAVGREVLIGVAVGCGFVAVLAVLAAAGGTLRAEGDGVLPDWILLGTTLSPLHHLSMLAHRASWATMDAAFIVGLLVALRLLTRHTLVAAIVGAAILGSFGSLAGFMSVEQLSSWPAIAFTVGGSAALVVLHTRVGILAGVVATIVLRPYQLLTTGLDTWFAGYGLADVALLLALVAYGFWVALAGQPVFRDMLAEPRPARS